MTEFLPPPLIRGPHLQTILASRGPRRARVYRTTEHLREISRDEIADCGSGVRLLVRHTPPGDSTKPRTIALFHGWEGSSESPYMLAASTLFWSQGFRVYRVNLRDHGPSHHLNKGLFHSCRLDEAVGAVRWIRERHPDDELLIGGYSLGGNFCLRIAASPNATTLRLKRVMAVCPVLDPVQTMYALDGGSVVYRRYFVLKWRRSLENKQAAFPGHYNFSELERFSSIGKMTEHFVNEYTDFPDLMTYLHGYAITEDRLEDLRVPAEIVMSRDDPVIPIADVERLPKSKNLRINVQEYGGHCGFLSNYRLESWLDQWFLNVIADPGPN